MTSLRFTDGVSIDTSGELRVIGTIDGLYVTGKGMLIPVKDMDEGINTIKQLEP